MTANNRPPSAGVASPASTRRSARLPDLLSPSSSSSSSPSRGSSYSLRTPPAVKVNYVHRIGGAHKRKRDSAPISSSKSAKRARAQDAISIKDEEDDVPVKFEISSLASSSSSSQSTPVEDLGEYTIEAIIARSLYTGYGPDGVKDYQYLVRWAGYGPADDTWEMASSLRETAGEMIDAFDAERMSISHPSYLLSTQTFPRIRILSDPRNVDSERRSHSQHDHGRSLLPDLRAPSANS